MTDFSVQYVWADTEAIEFDPCNLQIPLASIKKVGGGLKYLMVIALLRERIEEI